MMGQSIGGFGKSFYKFVGYLEQPVWEIRKFLFFHMGKLLDSSQVNP